MENPQAVNARGMTSAELPAELATLLGCAVPFQEEAFREQGEARLVLAPILTAANPDTRAEALQTAAKALNASLAHPSVVVRATLSARTHGTRLYCIAEEGHDALLRHLGRDHVVDGLLARLGQGEHGSELLSRCAAHVLWDEARGAARTCLALGEQGELRVRTANEDHASCARCSGEALLALRGDLLANGRQREGWQASLHASAALASRGEHRLAAELGQLAGELADTDEARVTALIQEGMCRLERHELPRAEEVLAMAAALSGSNQGFVAYLRGRVQLAWRDWIEALERFEEALANPNSEVAARDVHFQMAQCHVNLEEYDDARRHLSTCRGLGPDTASIAFYFGLCDLGEQRVEEALGCFEQALALGPAEEDRGRVLFYLGTSFKELGRDEEAIDVLCRAVEAEPEELAHHNLLGFCYYRCHRHEEAVACFRHAVAIDPRSGIDWASLGSNLRELGRIEEAAAMYEKALAVDPTIGFARSNLEKLRRVLGGAEGQGSP